MEKGENLVRGGCGHSEDEVKSSAAACGLCLIACAVAIVLALILR